MWIYATPTLALLCEDRMGWVLTGAMCLRASRHSWAGINLEVLVLLRIMYHYFLKEKPKKIFNTKQNLPPHKEASPF